MKKPLSGWRQRKAAEAIEWEAAVGQRLKEEGDQLRAERHEHEKPLKAELGCYAGRLYLVTNPGPARDEDLLSKGEVTVYDRLASAIVSKTISRVVGISEHYNYQDELSGQMLRAASTPPPTTILGLKLSNAGLAVHDHAELAYQGDDYLNRHGYPYSHILALDGVLAAIQATERLTAGLRGTRHEAEHIAIVGTRGSHDYLSPQDGPLVRPGQAFLLRGLDDAGQLMFDRIDAPTP